MRFPVLIFLIGILSMQVCAQDISNSFLVSELTADINQTGTIDVPSHGISRVIINFFVPQNTTNQFVGTSASLIKDSFGNSVLHMEYRHPSKKIRYSINSRIRVSGIKTKYIPTVYDVPEDFNIYLKPTKGIDCNDSRIRELAYSITNNSKSDFERIGKLAIWVYRNVQYDDYLKERVMNSTWVYENRRGTCDEFTTLFIALSRSIGIPARYVSGYKYSNGEWDRHAYSEVYIGEWIPVDPTNLEVGRLDATHIKFAVTDDNSVGSNLRVYGIFMNDVSWNSQTDIDILNYRMDKPIDYNLTISSDEFGAGDRAVVILKIMSTEYNVVKLILEECSSDFQFARVEDKEKYVILEPYKENIIYWVIDIDSNLNKNSL
ncbi:MAG TPA: hypothetical protein EYP86_05335 [Candidatus Altiarchaeales archaeon]|nr:hypothetical protein [Candidatus Altiarchaeales archaeon]